MVNPRAMVIPPPGSERGDQDRPDAERLYLNTANSALIRELAYTQAEFTAAGGAGFPVEKRIDGLPTAAHEFLRVFIVKEAQAGAATLDVVVRKRARTRTAILDKRATVYERNGILAGVPPQDEDRNQGHFGKVVAVSGVIPVDEATIRDATSLWVDVTCNTAVADVFISVEMKPIVPVE